MAALKGCAFALLLLFIAVIAKGCLLHSGQQTYSASQIHQGRMAPQEAGLAEQW